MGGKNFFDYDDGDFCYALSDSMAIDSDGNILMRISDNMVMDLDSGDLHIISSCGSDEDDDDYLNFGGWSSIWDTDD